MPKIAPQRVQSPKTSEMTMSHSASRATTLQGPGAEKPRTPRNPAFGEPSITVSRNTSAISTRPINDNESFIAFPQVDWPQSKPRRHDQGSDVSRLSARDSGFFTKICAKPAEKIVGRRAARGSALKDQHDES